MYETFVAATATETPAFYLRIMQDMHRQSSQFDPEVNPDARLSETSTVAEWREACDLLPWRQLAKAYNGLFQIECSNQQWKAALEPAKERTLGDVCELLSRHVRIPRVREVNIFGTACLPAGVFLTIRALLKEAGANCGEVAPSTPIADYSGRYFHVFFGSYFLAGARRVAASQNFHSGLRFDHCRHVYCFGASHSRCLSKWIFSFVLDDDCRHLATCTLLCVELVSR